jgi:hypothetical protein
MAGIDKEPVYVTVTSNEEVPVTIVISGVDEKIVVPRGEPVQVTEAVAQLLAEGGFLASDD